MKIILNQLRGYYNMVKIKNLLILTIFLYFIIDYVIWLISLLFYILCIFT